MIQKPVSANVGSIPTAASVISAKQDSGIFPTVSVVNAMGMQQPVIPTQAIALTARITLLDLIVTGLELHLRNHEQAPIENV